MTDPEDFQKAVAYIKADLEREINIAKNGENAGNYLCALALINYTELAGSMLNKDNWWPFKNNFNTGFYALNSRYLEFDAKEVSTLFKESLVLFNSQEELNVAMTDSTRFTGKAAFYHDENGYWFCVEKYYLELMTLFARIEQRLNL